MCLHAREYAGGEAGTPPPASLARHPCGGGCMGIYRLIRPAL